MYDDFSYIALFCMQWNAYDDDSDGWEKGCCCLHMLFLQDQIFLSFI